VEIRNVNAVTVAARAVCYHLCVPAPSKQETVYKILRERIEQSQYAPSQRLVIDSLARELGISQVPIREAIRRLEAEGLVLYSANSGPFVAPVSREQWFQLMEMLAILEGYATAAAAPRIGPPEIKTLRRIKGTMEEALAELDFPAWSSSHREFHRLIHGRCENEALVDQIEHIIQRADRVSLLAFARERGVIIHTLGVRTGKAIIEKHEDIIAALAERVPSSRIERITRQHVLDPVKQVKRLLERQRLDKSPAELNLLA
jgi:DNA-binding GntR family transcriptional regulator